MSLFDIIIINYIFLIIIMLIIIIEIVVIDRWLPTISDRLLLMIIRWIYLIDLSY